MYKVIVVLMIVVLTGCASAGGFVNGRFPLPGNDLVASLQQIHTIAKNASIAYDPSITDAEFDEWVAKRTFDQRRFTALIELYTMLAPKESLGDIVEYQKDMDASAAEFKAILKSR
tara:strand:- start:1374 stop:1721 length:348 start_codon:yes stop_codon:yes gene_type:complete